MAQACNGSDDAADRTSNVRPEAEVGAQGARIHFAGVAEIFAGAVSERASLCGSFFSADLRAISASGRTYRRPNAGLHGGEQRVEFSQSAPRQACTSLGWRSTATAAGCLFACLSV
jgi:hypothetical protein